MNLSNKYVIILLTVAVLLFAWHEIRPSAIRMRCQSEMDREVSSLKEINQKYILLKGRPEELRKALVAKYMNLFVSGIAEISQSEYDQLSGDEKKWYEAEHKIFDDVAYKTVADSNYDLCLRSYGLDAKWTYPKIDE